MNKQLKKKIEAELALLINNLLSTHNKQAAGAVTKHIKEGVKSIAKKFIKNLPEADKPKTAAKKTAAPKKKSAGLKKVKTSKSVKAKKAKPKEEKN